MSMRPELEILKQQGISFNNPHEIIEKFETTLATYSGAPYAVAVDCCTHAIELCLRYLKIKEPVKIPKHTYPSIPMTVLKLGGRIQWEHKEWQGAYQLEPYPIIDAGLRFTQGMYQPGYFFCLSFQQKKRLAIGRGGMILTDNKNAYDWLKKACYDGRTPGQTWKQDDIAMLGYHYYMTPEDAARGLLLFKQLPEKNADLGGWQDYPDITKFKVFNEFIESHQ